MKERFFHIRTFGCQMNEHDSERMLFLLEQRGYRYTPSPDEADLIIINTCSVREKPEQKVYSTLGRLKRLKEKRPNLIIAVGGCVAQQEGPRLQARMPYVDIVFGTHRIKDLPDFVEMAEKKKVKICRTEMDGEGVIPLRVKDGKVKAFVTIMQGCDNFCTFCVVPYVRGRERSRRPEEILDEIRWLADQGIKEVTLLGQNVNSYGKGLERPITFAELLRKIEEIEGIERIRFTTSHPKDLSQELIDCFGNLRKLCEHLHLPVQSGSNRILRMMRRGYTREEYLEKVIRLREVQKEIALTSDIMVGFPGEREEDFEESLDLLKKVRFHGLYSFKYSDRPMVRSASFDEKVPEEVKERRLAILQALQEEITRERNMEYEGTVQEVLVEGFNKKSPLFNLTGRTRTNAICHFHGDEKLIGNLLHVRVVKALKNSLLARRI